MHLRRCQTFRTRPAEPWERVAPRELGEAEREAILSACEAAMGAGEGRAEAAAILRGSRAERLRRAGLAECAAHGFFAGMDEAEVLARIDTLIHEGRLEARRDERGRVWLAVGGRGRARR